jgi:hypothetical protein
VFRIDRNQPLRWSERDPFGRSEDVIVQMQRGKTLMARWRAWPEGTETVTRSLDGFTAKLQEMRRKLALYRPGS